MERSFAYYFPKVTSGDITTEYTCTTTAGSDWAAVALECGKDNKVCEEYGEYCCGVLEETYEGTDVSNGVSYCLDALESGSQLRR